MVQIAMATMSLFIFLLLRRGDPIDGISQQQLEQPASLFTNNGSYKGTPWHNERTVSVKTVAETKFARCDVHTVQSENPNDSTVINDWVFMEEMDAVNVVVMMAPENPSDGSKGKFVVFKQGKYAIPGVTLSPVGGFVDVDKGESPFESARREVMEELGLGSRKTLEDIRTVLGTDTKTNIVNSDANAGGGSMDNHKVAYTAIPKSTRALDQFGLARGDTTPDEIDWVFLGRYRTAANRGGGFIYTYLLKNAVPILDGGGTAGFQMSGDDEAQEIHFLTLEEMQQHVLNGHFQEVKWAATIALGLLHLQNGP